MPDDMVRDMTGTVNWILHSRMIRRSSPAVHRRRPTSYVQLDDHATVMNGPVSYHPLLTSNLQCPHEDDGPGPVWKSLCPPEKTCPPEKFDDTDRRLSGYCREYRPQKIGLCRSPCRDIDPAGENRHLVCYHVH